MWPQLHNFLYEICQVQAFVTGNEQKCKIVISLYTILLLSNKSHHFIKIELVFGQSLAMSTSEQGGCP
jgi:hypothetical protein